MTYAGLETASDSATPHLGGNIKLGDPFTYCPSVWDYLIKRFSARSVLDLGSGYGNAADYFFRQGMKVIAVDGFVENMKSAVYPTILHDLTLSPFITNVDVVHCQEVVEHIEEQHIDNLMKSLCCGKICVMTHALPGQGGHYHVNLQPPEYWIEQMRLYNHILLEEDTGRVRRMADSDGGQYMSRTGMVFANSARL